ncbi:uncharacterized protein EAE98_009820 [Botrytis deweyae]|uniref:Amino acid permease/ SLC12A domain-containing protein n=1 Tax=Botrytis deweyae TaxID=2478750 RepID=A0ABQ7IB12_9HELO|nr:uncharacterized protein EAE98_009820 [Botrytis deweyae]KAF7918208.1 hypothetical protein EAE98_009820 [Botrytis deweyae]
MGKHISIEKSIDKGLVNNPGEPSSNTEDAIVLENLGYKPVGKRDWRCVSTIKLNQYFRFSIDPSVYSTTFQPHSVCISNPSRHPNTQTTHTSKNHSLLRRGVRVTFSTGIAAGDNRAYWTNFITSCVSPSSLRLSSQRYAHHPFIYERPKLAALAWVDCLALWSRGGAQLLGQVSVREILVFNIHFPSESSDVKFRALQWFTTEIMSALAATWNLLPPRYFKWIFYLSTSFVILGFLLNIIWLPLATARTIGIRSPHDAFITTYNGTGAPDAWHWCLSCLATAGILIGFDASGHVAEETKNAAVTAARGILWSTIISGIGGFAVVILFLFCVYDSRILIFPLPDPDTFFSFGGPQPFVPLYAVILEDDGHIFMNIIFIVALWLNTAIAVLAASRLLGIQNRQWPAQKRNSGGLRRISYHKLYHPTFHFSLYLSRFCCGSTINSYLQSHLSRSSFLTFPKPAWSLGRLSKPFQAIAVLWNAWVLAILYSPYVWPVEADTLNYAPVNMVATTILALISWWVTPAER